MTAKMKVKTQDEESTASVTTIVGVDVSKTRLEVAIGPVATTRDSATAAAKQKTRDVVNRERDLKKFLRDLPEGSALIVESSGTYHRLLCELACRQGILVLMVDPYRVHGYRRAENQRAKTDPCDARLLLRFGREKLHELQPYIVLSPQARSLQVLLRTRSHFVSQRVNIRQHIKSAQQSGGLSGLLPEVQRLLQNVEKDALAQIDAIILSIDTRIKEMIASDAEQKKEHARLLAIPGIGPISAACLINVLQRGTFATAEALIAFLGLDPVAQDSGQHNGRRRLSKKGDPHVRSVLFMAATSCFNQRAWKEWIARYTARGLRHAQVACIVARRLVTIAWCLYKRKEEFCAERMFKQPKSQLAVG